LSIVQTSFPTEEALGNLQGPVPENEMEILKQAFAALRAEIGVSELLEHNAIALDNLVRLQQERLLSHNYTPSDLERQIGLCFIGHPLSSLTLTPGSGWHQLLSFSPYILATKEQ